MNELANAIKGKVTRSSTHNGKWVPLYLEPIPGSGERICIGVAAADAASTLVVPVEDLERYSCVYGAAASSLAWSAELAIAEVEHEVSKGGLSSLTEVARRIEGLIIGSERRGAGTGLSDLAWLALQQVSALSSVGLPKLDDLAPLGGDHPTDGLGRLDSMVRRLVSERRPLLRENFGRRLSRSQSSRPLRYGFVGQFLAANFAQLHSRSSQGVGKQVDRAKARLWDLHHLHSGVLADSLSLHPPSMTYELLVHRPAADSGTARSTKAALKSAEEELEAEADKFDIRFRPLRSPDAIARYIVDREAA